MPHVINLLTQYSEIFYILPPIKIGTYFRFNPSYGQSDITVLIMKEIESNKEDQNDWFIKMVKEIAENTRVKILIIIFSRLNVEITNQRQISYQSQIPNSSIQYLNLEDWFPEENEKITIFESTINNFILSLKNEANSR
jgi:hypothetical protein